MGAHPNLPNTAGSPMDTNSPAKKSQNGNNATHNGDVNITGVNIENMNFQHGDDVVRSINGRRWPVAQSWLPVKNRPRLSRGPVSFG